jgi:hypothetical protein
MTRNDFWKLVDRLIGKTRGNLERFETAVDAHLKSLAAEEIEDFARHYGELQNEANTSGVLEAAYIIGCCESNDGFMDFRRWIVLQGRTAFHKIIQDPDYLGSYDRKSDPVEQWYCEYDPSRAYEEATGKELRRFDVAVYPDAEFDVDNQTKLAKRYPKLWKRMQGKKAAQQNRSDRGRALFLDARLDRIEADGESVRLVFSTGAEIRIRGYWPYYRMRYNVDDSIPRYDEHPMLGQTVVSIETYNFPQSFYMWFANRRKLSLGREQGDCLDFEVFDKGTRIHA